MCSTAVSLLNLVHKKINKENNKRKNNRCQTTFDSFQKTIIIFNYLLLSCFVNHNYTITNEMLSKNFNNLFTIIFFFQVFIFRCYASFNKKEKKEELGKDPVSARSKQGFIYIFFDITNCLLTALEKKIVRIFIFLFLHFIIKCLKKYENCIGAYFNDNIMFVFKKMKKLFDFVYMFIGLQLANRIFEKNFGTKSHILPPNTTRLIANIKTVHIEQRNRSYNII
ncbi:hypothetical protein RFI_20588 [Reticulomyxa filosa]|uniref:Uncharacterized protein n=1 Tax=Reticulomyxa filosa TaxID=46433 RepID=X6MTG3_RETFI|nr:hypothetical protein RFI_20588 [Reticulomyxa filosa]|eukprot:ETO16752.1 hypothetical protein RFI_20588 [Reticulomyxa filosa]